MTTHRLVIRIKLIPQAPPPRFARRPLNKSALLMIAATAILLSWIGISTFKSDAPPPPAEPARQPLARTTTPSAAAAMPVAPETQPRVDPPLAVVNEVIPDVPQSALDTVRGTVRVSVRVSIDKHGSVIDAVAEDRGPSRYFARLALDASRKWTFTPAQSDEARTMLVKFNFTRFGASAQSSPPHSP